MAPKLNEQGRNAQAECLRANGYPATARDVEAGLVEFDPGHLEMLQPNPPAD
jgi:hypothetical protein